MTLSTQTRRALFSIAVLIALAAPGLAQADAVSKLVPMDDAIEAQATILGAGQGATLKNSPWLISDLPRLGTTPVLRLKGMTPDTKGAILAGVGTQDPVSLPDTVQLYLDIDVSDTWMAIPYKANSAGGYSLPIALPNASILMGVSVTFQAFGPVLDQAEITNGLNWVLGV